MKKILNGLSNSDLPTLLRRGGMGVIPTDTVYGLVCQASNKSAVKRLYKLKSREGKPGTVIAATIDQLVELGIKARYLRAVEQFWPGPVSIIIPSGLNLEYLDLGLRTLAVRLPSTDSLNVLMQQTGPLLTTSANLPAEKPANNIEEAQNYFGDKLDFYVDGGDFTDQKSSTLIRIVDDAVEILRQGAVKVDEETGRIL